MGKRQNYSEDETEIIIRRDQRVTEAVIDEGRFSDPDWYEDGIHEGGGDA